MKWPEHRLNPCGSSRRRGPPYICWSLSYANQRSLPLVAAFLQGKNYCQRIVIFHHRNVLHHRSIRFSGLIACRWVGSYLTQSIANNSIDAANAMRGDGHHAHPLFASPGSEATRAAPAHRNAGVGSTICKLPQQALTERNFIHANPANRARCKLLSPPQPVRYLSAGTLTPESAFH